jgi:hypothetical protein
MTDTSKTEPEPNELKPAKVPKIIRVAEPDIAHVSTPFDGPKGQPETESDEGKQPHIPT